MTKKRDLAWHFAPFNTRWGASASRRIFCDANEIRYYRAMKLTERTLKLLEVMQVGYERVIYMPYQGRFNPQAYYFCHGLRSEKGSSRCTREAKALLKHGLAERFITNKYDGSHDLILTDAGRRYTDR